jgi:hypothetical protein
MAFVKGLVFAVMFLFVFIWVAGSGNSGSNTSSQYSTCLNDPITEYKIDSYKQKYPNLSKSQIAHTLCK